MGFFGFYNLETLVASRWPYIPKTRGRKCENVASIQWVRIWNSGLSQGAQRNENTFVQKLMCHPNKLIIWKHEIFLHQVERSCVWYVYANFTPFFDAECQTNTFDRGDGAILPFCSWKLWCTLWHLLINSTCRLRE